MIIRSFLMVFSQIDDDEIEDDEVFDAPQVVFRDVSASVVENCDDEFDF
jgi:hypothetical protein